MNKILRILIPVLIVGIGLAGVYYYYERRLAKEASYLPPPSKTPGLSPEKAALEQESQKERLENTLRSMDETRKLNERAGADPKNLMPAQDPTAEVRSEERRVGKECR